MIHQNRDIGWAFAQRWHLDPNHVNSIEKIGTKPTLYHFSFEIAVSGTDQPNVNRAFIQSAEPHSKILQGIQELGLKSQIELPYLI